MNWEPIDFQGIVDLDHKIVEQLEQFLQEKENRLAHQILNIIPLSSADPPVPVLPVSENPIKLSEAVEEFSKRVRLFNKGESHRLEPRKIVKEVNAIFWEFTEVLEGCAIELFQQITQVSIDRWHLTISSVVQAIKNVLIHYIDDLIWIIRRLEKPLKEYCQKLQITEQKNWFDHFFSKESDLDPNLLKNLQQTEKYLKDRYDDFHQRYNEYMKLSAQVENFLEKMKSYPILALLGLVDQNLYIDLFRLLKAKELNPQPKGEVAKDTTRALKQLTSIDNVIRVLRSYYRELKDAFFNSSLEWKSLNHESETFQTSFERLKEKIKEYQHELHALMHTMSSYRAFILKNDSNPYIRSRWGFSEWIVAPEPAKAKKLTQMVFLAKELDNDFSRFHDSLTRDFLTQQKIESKVHQDIESLLHEMGQPLISQSMMRNRVEHLLEKLNQCDEIGSPHMSTVVYVESVLSKVMRQDWKYHVLHEFPLFHQIYYLHQGLIEYFDDPTHAFRLERFRLLFDQIKEWIEKEDIYSHVHEIDLDMNDMKTYLQDFLATVQRATKQKSHDPFLDETAYKLRQQLLEYRYLFGQFFLFIMSKNLDGIQLRNQFLFVDQYFETIENLLNELNMTWEGKR